MAVFALPVLLVGFVLVRAGRVEPYIGFAVMGAGTFVALLAVLLAFMAFAAIWRDGSRGLGTAIRGMLLGAVVLAPAAALAGRFLVVPEYRDITTDRSKPPAFSRSAVALAARNGFVPGNICPEPWPLVAEAATSIDEGLQALRNWGQELSGHDIGPLPLVAPDAHCDIAHPARKPARYPGLTTLNSGLSPDEALAVVTAAAKEEGWTVIETVPPGQRFGIARLEAVDHTLVLSLPVDITIRLRTIAGGTAIDVRAASRTGLLDIGAGPGRIQRLFERVQARS